MSVLLIVLIHAFIHIALRVTVLVRLLFLPFTVTVLESIIELTCITAAILPLVLTKSFRLAFLVLTNVAVTVGEEIGTVSMA